MAPKLGDIVFIKNVNPHTGAFHVEPAMVTQTFTADDGEWTQDGTVVGLRSFSPDGVDTVGEQQGPATYDDNGIWNSGYALTPDGEEVKSLDKAEIVEPVSENPTVAAGGVSRSDVAKAIAANNETLLTEIRGLLSGQAQAPAPEATPADGSPSEDAGVQEAQHSA